MFLLVKIVPVLTPAKTRIWEEFAVGKWFPLSVSFNVNSTAWSKKMERKVQCPIWSTESVERTDEGWVRARTSEPVLTQESVIVSDRAGGAYKIEPQVKIGSLLEGLSDQEKARLTTRLVDQRRQGIAIPVVTLDFVESFRATGESDSLLVPERAERLLHFIAEQTKKAGDHVAVFPDSLSAYAWTESTEWNEVDFLLDYLRSEELIVGRFSMNGGGQVRVTVKGYARVAERATNPDSTQAFVAMWFDDETEPAYKVGIELAVRQAGYRPMRIDRKPDVVKIDDEILAEIRRSRFLVADMTHGDKGPRGGVYFEAGFALGLGLPVLYSCRSDKMDEIHFDTRQYYHIKWDTPEELREELVQRIGAVVGDGPLRDTQ